MLLGLALIAVPLLVAILHAAVQIQALATSGQQIVKDGAAAARGSQTLYGQVAYLERIARIYDLLNKPDLLEDYKRKDTGLTATRNQLYAHADPDTAKTLSELGAEQEGIRVIVTAMQAGTGTRFMPDLSPHFAKLSSLVDRVVERSNKQIDEELAALDKQTRRARGWLYFESALLLPLTLVTIIVLTFSLARPLRTLDRAISELGQGTFSHPITVKGPLDLERLGRQLEWLRLRLLDLAEGRNRFLRHISHELKTPLANIRDGAELLMDGTVGELDASQREVMTILRDNSIKLHRMIENLLSFSAWESSRTALERREFRLRPLIKQVLENQQLTILSQRIRLDLRVDDVMLVADRGKMRLILENLLSNAIKYSPKGGTIHIKAHTAEQLLRLDVADHGPGIPAPEREHIFEAFFTGRAARNTEVKGTGIGLSVVLEFVSAHGGGIEIIDGEYPGAHFRITMPVNGREVDSATGGERKAHAHAA
jgi:two-component system sensor histidine kinase GlrK